jgi:hypothetical protein
MRLASVARPSIHSHHDEAFMNSSNLRQMVTSDNRSDNEILINAINWWCTGNSGPATHTCPQSRENACVSETHLLISRSQLRQLVHNWDFTRDLSETMSQVDQALKIAQGYYQVRSADD